MPIQIGAPPESGFGRPLRLMSECHRRIERYLGVLERLVGERRGGPLEPGYRASLAEALDYFRHAAPLHTEDEEVSLFPRLRASGDPRATAALDRLAALEADHRDAEARHALIERLGRRWLADGALTVADIRLLEPALAALRGTYRPHIAEEDAVIFPLAESVLTPDALAAIGREMARRRG